MEVMERKETLKFLKSLNAEVLEGINISSCAEKMYDATKGRNTTFLPLAIKEVWFKKKYPLSRVEWDVTFPTDTSMETQESVQKLEVTAKAIVSVNGIETEIGNAVAVMYADDEAVKTIPVEKGRRYDAMKAFCIGTARSKALYNAGFGREFYGEEDDLQLLSELEKESKKEKEEKETTAPSTLDAALDTISSSSSVASFVPVVEESESLRMPTIFGGGEETITPEKPKKAAKSGFQQTLDGYFEEVLGLVPDVTGKGLVPSGNVCMLDEVMEQKKIKETADETVAEEAEKVLKKCEKRLTEINTWITKRGAVKMDKLYRSEDRIPLTIDSLIEMAEKKEEVKDILPALSADKEDDFFNMSSEEIDALADASDKEPDYLDFVPEEVDGVQSSLFGDFQEDTDYRRMRCSSEKGDFLGKTYGEIIEDNPDVLSYLLDSDTPDYEAKAIIGLAKDMADSDSRFEDLYKSVLRKEKLRTEALDGVGDFS